MSWPQLELDQSLKAAELVRNDVFLALHSLLISGASLLIVAGMLATPTNCGCGAGISHAHSLFLLAGHHHNSAGRHVRLHAPAGHVHPMHAAGAKPGPRLAALRGHAAERIAMVAATFLSLTVIWRRLRLRLHDSPCPADYHRAPEPPPPRSAALAVTS